MSKSLIFSFVFLFMLTFDTVSSQKCHLRELDFCAATLLVLGRESSNPTGSDTEIDRHCGFIREADECRQNFTNKCATPMQRELIDFFLIGSKKAIEELCTAGTSLREEYKKHAKCLGEARRESKKCANDLQSAVELVTESDWDKRITLACCGFNRFQKCTTEIVEDNCGSEAVDVRKKFTHLAVSRLPEILCANVHHDECKELLPPEGSSPKGAKSSNVLGKMFAMYMS